MKEVKYIPGDLVTDSTKKIYIVRSSKNDSDIYFVTKVGYEVTMLCSSRQMSGVPITPSILEANGWKTQNKWYYFLGINKGFFTNIGIDFVHKSSNDNLYVEVNGSNMAEIQYCHQLQHLLFGLGLDSSLKV